MDFEGLSIAGCLSCWNGIKTGKEIDYTVCMNSTFLNNLPWKKPCYLRLWYEIWVYCFCLFCLTHFTAQDRPAMQLYQPGARNRKRMGSGNKAFDFSPISPDHGGELCYKTVIGTGSEKSADEWKKKTMTGRSYASIGRTLNFNLVFLSSESSVSIVHWKHHLIFYTQSQQS